MNYIIIFYLFAIIHNAMCKLKFNDIVSRFTSDGVCDLSDKLITSIAPNGFCLEISSTIFEDTCRENVHIEVLRLNNNKLKKIESENFNYMPRLTELRLSNNTISEIAKGTFNEGSKFKILYLDSNSLKILKKNMFNGLSNLAELFVGSNNIDTIEMGAFYGMDKLNKLSLDNNSIYDSKLKLFNGLFNLRYLDLSSNKLTVLKESFISYLNNLKTLNLNSNGFNIFDFQILNHTSITNLSIADNKMELVRGNISVSSFLSTVNLSNNSIFNFEIIGLERYLTTGKQLIIEHNVGHLSFNCKYKWIAKSFKTQILKVKFSSDIIWESRIKNNNTNYILAWKCLFEYSLNTPSCVNYVNKITTINNICSNDTHENTKPIKKRKNQNSIKVKQSKFLNIEFSSLHAVTLFITGFMFGVYIMLYTVHCRIPMAGKTGKLDTPTKFDDSVVTEDGGILKHGTPSVDHDIGVIVADVRPRTVDGITSKDVEQ